jgi:hypothetical protein
VPLLWVGEAVPSSNVTLWLMHVCVPPLVEQLFHVQVTVDPEETVSDDGS